MERAALVLAFGALLAAPGAAQADARLYHHAWYLEHVARRPEEALQKYRRLCADHPDSPLRFHALARQADLLRRLRRPREAAAILETLAREAPDPVLLRDQEALEANAEKIRERDALLQELLRLRLELALVAKELAQDQSPEAKARLEGEAGRLRSAIEELRPRLLAGIDPAVLEVKREAQIQGLQSDEARQIGAEMVRLRDLARALEEAGKLREARQALQELERQKGRYRMLLERFRGRPGPFMAAESRARFLEALERGDLLREIESNSPGRFWVRSQFVRFLTSPGEVLGLDPTQRRHLLQDLGPLVASVVRELEGVGQTASARKLEACLAQVLQAEEQGHPTELEEKLQELGGLLTPIGWRPGGPGPGPGWPMPGIGPGGRNRPDNRGTPPPMPPTPRGQRP